MDSQMFRLPSAPNLYRPTAPVDIRTMAKNQSVAAPNSRYPGWPAPMSDARLVTDYSPHCSHNIPAGRQFPTKVWMQKNTDAIIQSARIQTAYSMGGVHLYASNVVPPPTEVASCSRSECSRSATGAPGGIGLERREPVPELFGTYSLPFTPEVGQAGQMLTQVEEGGRNTRR
jgi:hypothetical protein